MTNPVVDLIGDRTGRIVPIYPQSEKVQINTWEIAGWVEEALRRCRDVGSPTRCRRPSCNASACSDDSTRCRTSTCPSRSATRSRPVAGSRSTSCCGCSSCWCCASGRWSATNAGSPTTCPATWSQRFHDALPYPLTGAQRRAIAEIERDLAAPASDAPAAAGRRRLGQDRRRRRRAAGRGAGRPPGGADGADRGARRAARTGVRALLDGRQRARSGQPLRRPAAAGRAADEPGHRRPIARTCSPAWPTARSTSSSAPTR